MTRIDYSAHTADGSPRRIGAVLGANIRRFRFEQGISQIALAHMSGMSRQFLAQVEQGNADVRLSYLKRIADALCVSPSELLKEYEN